MLAYQIFCIQVYGNMVEENIMHQQVQKYCREKVGCIKCFWANWAQYPLHLQKIACSHAYEMRDTQLTEIVPKFSFRDFLA